MDKISCAVIKDLLPLYVDEVLSEDSCKLVKSHIATCNDCKEYYESMKNTDYLINNEKNNNEKEVIKKIRRKINIKKISLICLTAVVVISIAIGTFYGIVIKDSYIPYEDTGLYIDNNELCTNEPYHCYYRFDSPEEGTSFMYMSNTFYGTTLKEREKITIDDFDSSESSDDDVKQLYYVPQEYVEFLSEYNWIEADSEEEYIAKNKDKLDELKKNSTLVWKAE